MAEKTLSRSSFPRGLYQIRIGENKKGHLYSRDDRATLCGEIDGSKEDQGDFIMNYGTSWGMAEGIIENCDCKKCKRIIKDIIRKNALKYKGNDGVGTDWYLF